MEYEVYLRREVFEVLRQCRGNERELLLRLLPSLGQDPIGGEILRNEIKVDEISRWSFFDSTPFCIGLTMP